MALYVVKYLVPGTKGKNILCNGCADVRTSCPVLRGEGPPIAERCAPYLHYPNWPLRTAGKKTGVNEQTPKFAMLTPAQQKMAVDLYLEVMLDGSDKD